MSFGNNQSGGRTRMGTKVTVNVYDLSPANDVLYAVGFGLHHSGVEILGTEYSFAQGAGIFEQTPRDVPNAKYRESIEMGTYEGSSSDLRVAISDLKDEFRGESYHLLKRNCNHFANALVWALLRKTIPAHVNRLAEIGGCCSCLLPKSLLEDSPVHAPGSEGSSGGFSMQAPPGGRRPGGGAANTSAAAFSGGGMKLGGTSESAAPTDRGSGSGFGLTQLIGRAGSGGSDAGGKSPGRNGDAADDLTDRRERARKAAMARLGQPASDSGGAGTASMGNSSDTGGYKQS